MVGDMPCGDHEEKLFAESFYTNLAKIGWKQATEPPVISGNNISDIYKGYADLVDDHITKKVECYLDELEKLRNKVTFLEAALAKAELEAKANCDRFDNFDD